MLFARFGYLGTVHYDDCLAAHALHRRGEHTPTDIHFRFCKQSSRVAWSENLQVWQVSLSLIVNFEELFRATQSEHSRRIHPAFVLVFDLLAMLGLLFSAYLVLYLSMFQFALVRDVIWVSTALA